MFKTINLARNESLPNPKLSAGSVSESDINKNAMKHDDTNSSQSLRQQFRVFLGLLPQHMNNRWKQCETTDSAARLFRLAVLPRHFNDGCSTPT